MAIRRFHDVKPHMGERVYVDDSAVVIGEVTLGDDSSVWPNATVRGDVNSIRVGRRTNIQDGAVVHVTHRYGARPEGNPVVIGDDVTIGHNVTIHGCTIEDQCLVGIGATVLDGAIIRSRVLVGAGSLVAEGKELESGFLYLGVPAKKARPLTEEELKWFEYSAEHYRKLKDEYLGT